MLNSIRKGIEVTRYYNTRPHLSDRVTQRLGFIEFRLNSVANESKHDFMRFIILGKSQCLQNKTCRHENWRMKTICHRVLILKEKKHHIHMIRIYAFSNLTTTSLMCQTIKHMNFFLKTMHKLNVFIHGTRISLYGFGEECVTELVFEGDLSAQSLLSI